MKTWVLLGVVVASASFPPGTPAAAQGLGSVGQIRAEEAEPITLTRAVTLALDSHPLVGRAEAAAESADARIRQARAAWFPSLQTQGSLTRYQEPWVVAPLHRFDPSSPPLFDETLLQSHVVLGYTLFDGGARGARVRQAQAGAAAASEGEREVRMDLTVQVSAAYLGVLSARELLDASRAFTTALGSELDRVNQFLAEGKAARVDLLRVQAALSGAEAAEISARTDLDLALGDLARLIGVPPEEIRAAGLSPINLQTGASVLPQEALAAARSRNPLLARAQRELAGAEAGLRLARADWFPRLESVSRFTNYGTWSGNHTQEWQAGVSLAFPIFTGGARAGNREAAQAHLEEVAERVRISELEVEAGVERGLAALEEASALSQALQTAVAQYEEVTRIEALALEAGAGVQTDFLRAEAELFQTRASLVQARNREVLARIQLARIMGDLTPRWIQDNVEGDQ